MTDLERRYRGRWYLRLLCLFLNHQWQRITHPAYNGPFKSYCIWCDSHSLTDRTKENPR